MSAPKNFKEFMAQQKAKKKQISKSPIEKLINELKTSPDKFISNYEKDLSIILSQENHQLNNLQDENLITLFIDSCQTNPDLKNNYNNFMKLAEKGFLTINKNKETFLFELSRRNNLKLFFETILNLYNLNLLTDELLLVENINSENCFSSIIKSISTTVNKIMFEKKEYNDLIEKVFKLLLEKFKIFDGLPPLDKFNVFNYFTKIKISEKVLNTITKEDILKDLDIIFSNEKTFNICKIILFDKQLPFNLLNSFLENHFDLIDVFIEKYSKNNFCHFPELFFDFLFHILNFETYQNNIYFYKTIFPIILKEKDFFEKLKKASNGNNIYHILFSNQKISQKEKNLIFSYINENMLNNSDDMIKELLAQENKEGYPPFIIYLLNTDFKEIEEENFFKNNILEKTIYNKSYDKNNKKYKYQNSLLNLLSNEQNQKFLILFEFLEKNKLINLFEEIGSRSLFIKDLISIKITSNFIISKIVSFIIQNFDLVNSIFRFQCLNKFIIHYLNFIKNEELKQIIMIMETKFSNDIKNEEDTFIEKINKINKIEYKQIDKKLFSFNSKYIYFYDSIKNLISEIWFNQEYNLEETKDILLSLLSLIGVYIFNEIILDICFLNQKFKPEIIDIFIEQYYSKFKLSENHKQLQYFSIFNFQNSFYNNETLKNNNCMYFYLRFIKGISNPDMKIYYQCVIFSVLNIYQYEQYLPLFFSEKEKQIINNYSKLFIKPKLLSDEIKLTLLASLLDYETYKKFYINFTSKIDSSKIYSVLDKINNNKKTIEINIIPQFNEKIEKNQEYKKACDLLNKHFILKFYFCFFNCLVKKGKIFKFQNYCMKKIAEIMDDENLFIEISNQQMKDFIEYHFLIKENNLRIGMENDTIKNENNVFGKNVLFLLFNKMIQNNFLDENLNSGNLSENILYLENAYLKEFNIINNNEEEQLEYKNETKPKIYHENNINDDNINNKDINNNINIDNAQFYNLEKYIIQLYNFNDFVSKLNSDSYKIIFKVFKDITEKIKETKFIEILFSNKNDLLRNIHTKMDFEKVVKYIIKDKDNFDKIIEKVKELKEIKEMNFYNFFNCLSKFYNILIE